MKGKAKRAGTNERPPTSFVGVQRGEQNDKRGKESLGLRDYGSSSESPCDECVKIRLLRTSGKSNGLGLISEPLIGESNRSHKVSVLDHQDSSHLASQGDHTEGDTSGLDCESSLIDAGVHDVQVSTNPESSGQPRGGCLPKGDWFSSLDVLASLSLVFQECEYRKVCPFFAQTFAGVSQESLVEAGSKAGISLTADASASRKSDKVYDFSVPYPYYTIEHHLKAKDLCLIPQHLAIAFQRDGWWVRSIIIWSKNNPMP